MNSFIYGQWAVAGRYSVFSKLLCRIRMGPKIGKPCRDRMIENVGQVWNIRITKFLVIQNVSHMRKVTRNEFVFDIRNMWICRSNFGKKTAEYLALFHWNKLSIKMMLDFFILFRVINAFKINDIDSLSILDDSCPWEFFPLLFLMKLKWTKDLKDF